MQIPFLRLLLFLIFVLLVWKMKISELEMKEDSKMHGIFQLNGVDGGTFKSLHRLGRHVTI